MRTSSVSRQKLAITSQNVGGNHEQHRRRWQQEHNPPKSEGGDRNQSKHNMIPLHTISFDSHPIWMGGGCLFGHHNIPTHSSQVRNSPRCLCSITSEMWSQNSEDVFGRCKKPHIPLETSWMNHPWIWRLLSDWVIRAVCWWRDRGGIYESRFRFDLWYEVHRMVRRNMWVTWLGQVVIRGQLFFCKSQSYQ